MGLDFTAVDFETANGFRGSPCSVGLVRVRDGVEVDSLYRLMRPPLGFDRFDPQNVGVHGIEADHVAAEPRFDQLFPELMDFLDGDDLVAHNATFDVEVFESSLEVSGLDAPGLRAWCSVQLARAVYRLPSHALPHAAAEAGHRLTAHHHALADARACTAVVVDVASRLGTRSVEDTFRAEALHAVELSPWTAPRSRESRATRQVRRLGPVFDARDPTVDPWSLPDLMRWQEEGRNPPPNPDADPDHPLFGEQVVFSGTLAVPRPRAKQLCASRGARTASRVTAGTTVIVIGDGLTADDIEHRGPNPPPGSRKVTEALRRRSAGQPIRVMDEETFDAVLNDLPVRHGGVVRSPTPLTGRRR
ncbi:exonuclease domain-containing protein [Nesterenkonia marinintestina]|uniref:exonuclease domain-containing protein n=1 Tax=Nesterenkonia marinintestina TaxID=2979865 RepID=UPI0021BDF699|nr:exonuclease domain-containing protein [Nesterenkonia sp. GX14115]